MLPTSFNIKKIQFNLKPEFLLENVEKNTKEYFKDINDELNKITKKVGTNNNDFQKKYRYFLDRIIKEKNISQSLQSKYDIRLYAYLLMNDGKFNDDSINKAVLSKINQITDRPSFILIEAISEYFFHNFSYNSFFENIGEWVIEARKKRNIYDEEQNKIFSFEGPKYLANKASQENCDFKLIVQKKNLEQYKGTKYIQLSQGYYYLETLKNIATDEYHHVLNEVQQKDVYNTPFEDNLLGHKILEIIIKRCPKNKIHEKWQEVILKIAGDPRVHKNHERFLKWWQYLDDSLVAKVKGWFSAFDVNLFLQAMEDYAKGSRNIEMQRMFPARKKFLEGLLEKELVVDTRLFLSREMEKYLKIHFKKEELPNYSIVYDTDKSIIYIDLENAKMIEGSHSCYLWIFSNLKKNANIFDLSENQFSYNDLTSGLSYNYAYKNALNDDKIVHNGLWQKRAVESLQSLKIDIHIKDVLTSHDWREYKRNFGVY